MFLFMALISDTDGNQVENLNLSPYFHQNTPFTMNSFSRQPSFSFKTNNKKNIEENLKKIQKYRIHISSLNVTMSNGAIFSKPHLKKFCKRLKVINIHKRQDMNQSHTIKNDLSFLKRICQTSSTLRKLTLTIEGQRKNFLQNQIPLFHKSFSRLLKSPKFQYLKEFQLKLKNGFNINKLELDVNRLRNSKNRNYQFKMNILNNENDETQLIKQLILQIFRFHKVAHFVTNYSSQNQNTELCSEKFISKMRRIASLDLDFSKTIEFKPDSYDLLTHLHKLKELNFNFSQNNFEDATLQQFFEKLPELKNIQGLSFDFNLCSHMTDSTKFLQFKQLCQLPNLQKFDLNFDDCGQMTDSSLRYLSKSLAKLSHIKDFKINLSNLGRITSDGLSHILVALNRSVFLDSLEICLKNCPKICSNTVIRIAELLKLKKSLKSLSLDFGGCKLISSEALQKVISATSQLEGLENLKLSFKSLSGLEDESMRLLVGALKMLKKLQNIHLDFSYCSNINSASVENLSRYLRQNKQSFEKIDIDFYGCSDITTREIQTFKQQLMNFTSI